MLAGLLARIEETRLLKYVMPGKVVAGVCCVRGQEKEWMECFLNDLRAFGINTDRWATAAQDEGEWRRTVGQGAKRFIAKSIAAEKARAGLRHAVCRPSGLVGKLHIC